MMKIELDKVENAYSIMCSYCKFGVCDNCINKKF